MSADPVLAILRGPQGWLPAGDTRWEEAARRAVADHLAGAVLTRLDQTGRREEVPGAALRTLESDLTRVRVAQTLLFGRFAELAGCLRAAGVPFIVHKGGALAATVYARAEDRPMVDIDVIVRPRDWRPVREALTAAGYRMPGAEGESFWRENYFNVPIMTAGPSPAHFDLHWGLAQEGRYHVDTAGLFERAVPYAWGDGALLRLGDEDLLLSLFLHLAYHYFEARLLWLYDMKRVIESWRPDWGAVLDRASSWGLRTVVSFNLAYLDKVFPGTVPCEAARAGRAGWLRRTAVRPLLSRHPRRLFRGEGRRAVQLYLGMAGIDWPADMALFAAGKMARGIRWAGRHPGHRH